MEGIDTAIKFGLLALTSYFTIMNPFGVMPVFVTMTANLSKAERRKTALKATITAFFTLLLFALTGQFLFNFFGISANAFRVVGGIIFFMMGYDMLQARLIRTKMTDESAKSYVTDISITPLAIPMLSGPGAITNSIVLMEDAKDIGEKTALVISMIAICVITLAVLLSASTLSKFLGETGNKILMRLMGLIVMVIAVEFMINGLGPIIQDIVRGIN
ncbi:MAG: NAAT family transporter [Bernardetiaceae bacterium]|nr:NAAT family transporter [Bernardetiaceae bacterium]